MITNATMTMNLHDIIRVETVTKTLARPDGQAFMITDYIFHANDYRFTVIAFHEEKEAT